MRSLRPSQGHHRRRQGREESDAVIIAVPTPLKCWVADLSHLGDALESVKEGMHKGLLVVVESTVPPGTTVGLAKPCLRAPG
jgi:UDP-N-acetyl-D-mannosaminuronate dehydrogenase